MLSNFLRLWATVIPSKCPLLDSSSSDFSKKKSRPIIFLLAYDVREGYFLNVLFVLIYDSGDIVLL